MSSRAESVVAALAAAVDGLLDVRLDALSGPELVDVLKGLEVQRRRLDAVDVRVVAEADERRVAGESGRASTLDLLARSLRVSPREAKARVERARELGPRVALSGETLPPLLPATSRALGAGEVSGAHAAVIGEAMCLVDDLPDATLLAPVAEQFLVQAAGHEDPVALRRTAAMMLARLNPDGIEPHEDEIARRRGFTLAPNGGGSAAPTGRLTGEATAVWQTILDSLSAPMPAGDGVPDPRTAAQRRHDAFLEAGLRLLRSGTLPESGGVPVTVLVRTTPEDLSRPDGLVRTAHGELLSTRRALSLAGGVDLVRVGLDAAGGVLSLGRTRRLASPPQRRALAARDGGCCFPGCTRPAAWTEAHHVIAWIAGGPTDVDNLCLVCPFHHRVLDHGDWQVSMIDKVPHWLPPPWLDPDRQPVRNTAHHLPEAELRRSIDDASVRRPDEHAAPTR